MSTWYDCDNRLGIYEIYTKENRKQCCKSPNNMKHVPHTHTRSHSRMNIVWKDNLILVFRSNSMWTMANRHILSSPCARLGWVERVGVFATIRCSRRKLHLISSVKMAIQAYKWFNFMENWKIPSCRSIHCVGLGNVGASFWLVPCQRALAIQRVMWEGDRGRAERMDKQNQMKTIDLTEKVSIKFN